MNRVERQRLVGDWVLRCFGELCASPVERARRLVEEAAKLAQCEGVTELEVRAIAARVMSREPGAPAQEAGGVSVCLLAYCQAKGLAADFVEAAELRRVLSVDPEYFRRRQSEKAALGIGFAPTEVDRG